MRLTPWPGWCVPSSISFFPKCLRDHPVHGSIIMNFAANMLGLDNAATPLGLKAMQELQELNPDKETASNAQIMFLVLNTSGLTVIPISIMVYRAQMGAANPSDIFLPILLTTFFSTLAGLIAVGLIQRINLFDRTVMAYLMGLTALVGATIVYFSRLPQEQVETVSNIIANVTLFGDHLRLHTPGHAPQGECVRGVHRRCQGRFHRRRQDHSLPGGDPCGHRSVPGFRRHGLPGGRDRTGVSPCWE